jgi:ribonuclease R
LVKAPGKPRAQLPSKDELLAFIGKQPGKVGTREMARAFNLKNNDRAALKRMLRELSDEGRLEHHRKKLHPTGALPSVVVADITERDRDGEFIAVPTEWDEEAHGVAPRIRVHAPRRARPAEIAGIGDRVLLRTEETEEDGGIRHRGRVTRIMDRAKLRVLGIFRPTPDGGGRLVPVDKKQMGRELTIPAVATLGAQEGDLITVEVARSGRSGLPVAHVMERLGSLTSERAVSLIAIHAHSLPHVFPREVLAEAQAMKPAMLDNREDWRKLPLVTIDPPDAKDHDDAVHATRDKDPANPGGFVITVAIADVGHYVQPGSALDREAAERGNSVYFPDRVIPMLPERISNDLCSLRPHEDRAALAVRMVIGPDGRKRSHSFHRVMMRSAAKLHYLQAQAAIDGHADEITKPILGSILEPLWASYELLKKERAEREPLDLELPERKIVLTAAGMVDHVVTAERRDAHKLIEEFMILANVAAAEMLERSQTPLIYRVHDEPSPEKVHGLHEFLEMLDISFPKSGALRPHLFNGILKRVKDSDNEALVNEVVLRSQAQAEYSAENYGHFGLNLRRYAHFTSPIRRYADLIVHRGLIRALKLGNDGLPPAQDATALGEVAARISAAERRAMKAERETVDRLIAHHLADRVGAQFEGRIGGVTGAGLFIKLNDTGADGFIPARTIGDEFFRFDERSRALIGNRSGETYRLGDTVSVKLVEAAPVAGALRFELLSSGKIEKRKRPHSGAEHEGYRKRGDKHRGRPSGPPKSGSRKSSKKSGPRGKRR